MYKIQVHNCLPYVLFIDLVHHYFPCSIYSLSIQFHFIYFIYIFNFLFYSSNRKLLLFLFPPTQYPTVIPCRPSPAAGRHCHPMSPLPATTGGHCHTITAKRAYFILFYFILYFLFLTIRFFFTYIMHKLRSHIKIALYFQYST